MADIDKSKPVLVDVFDGVVVFRNDVPELEKTGSKRK
jgi:ATP-dependent Clp protease ATP-binding subunit ClpB